jgi:hypothetical protein
MSEAKPPPGGWKLSIDHAITIGTILVAVAAAWTTSTGRIEALASRIDRGETVDRETGHTLGTLQREMVELRVELRQARLEIDRMRQQNDQIIGLLNGKPYQQRGNP